ncbi:choice-of-anchor D domain-containing protein [Desulfovibrio sulfodismutans]|uniref:Choice-of-anchor D domain-containing protein n=1 Tax=Desulfolutivibrio sulfodismutans TaxID=63561 RepID=A0A7K3NRU6_9BACT|nr:choice-of-anchor D domain-containing protein [Desulfolutivibrio sulfodismutans]NDY57929.1 choice-of-anchor D domain-containing protein [Desulfolutivibrio sulfodismutans]
MRREHHAIPLSASHARIAPRRPAALAAVLLALACLWTGRAEAVVCWGKVCPGADCCSGHGTCTAFNTCVCDPGYVGKECESKPVEPDKTAIDFGAVAVGSTTSQSLLLSVLAGTGGLSATLSGEGSGDYTVTSACPATFTQATSCALIIGFSPTAVGSRPATLTLAVTSLPVSLSGTGSATVRAIAADPVAASTLYAAIAGSGVYASADGGATWTAATVQPSDTRLTALAIKPGDTATLFAATDGGGVFISRDSGLTWNACADTGLDSPNVLSLIVTGAGQLFAGTGAGVFASSNDCSSWTEQNTGLPE